MRAYQPKSNEWYEVMVRITGKDKLCETCDRHLDTGACWNGWYPITSDGKDCPYYKKGEEMK
jgi:hypothetical protein